jgi:hypothetical protein
MADPYGKSDWRLVSTICHTERSEELCAIERFLLDESAVSSWLLL